MNSFFYDFVILFLFYYAIVYKSILRGRKNRGLRRGSMGQGPRFVLSRINTVMLANAIVDNVCGTIPVQTINCT